MNLLALPDLTGTAPSDLAAVDAYLSRMEEARRRQLEELAARNVDVVAAAYRATVERILEEVRVARHRVAIGRYGTCARCEQPIAARRLEAQPLTATCVLCAEQVTR